MKRKYLNSLSKLALIAVVFSFTSCREKGGLASEYMPDMFRSPSVEAYVDYGELRGKQGNDAIRYAMSARIPVKGTIPRGFTPYPYENSIAGEAAAAANLKSPFPMTEKTINEGKILFGMFCVHCHGTTGQGDGSLVQNGKFPPLPVKFAPGLDIPEGRMFHSITYGRNLMGSHASQLNKEERWLLIHYIRGSFMGLNPNSSVTDTANVDTANVVIDVAKTQEKVIKK
ncbi:MAG: cytochrome C [Flavobacteriales bacterium CG_4_10_14_0_2_um_filter_32_8]|nr:MAG: cytochrome C [Flavobacteriales bacterium CG_4_10_14_0_2_um_filter_32_8]PJB15619.1 MAG: cytochrome C [Flavobacteriales bacterium CG_4_9_14_3_um_filter_32_8]